MSATAWLVVVCAALTLLLAASTLVLLARASSVSRDPIPVVGTIDARPNSGTILFTWDDPGIEPGDSYVIRTDEGRSSTQRTNRFVVDPGDREQVCVEVSVNRGGRIGEASSEKCATTDGAQ